MKRFLHFPKPKYSVQTLFILLLLVALMLFAWGARAQAPAVSYTGLHGYTVGNPITPLSPANTGGAVAVTYNGSPQAISLAFSHTQQLAQGLTIDNKGNLYVTDFANGHQILEYTNGQVIQLASGFNQPGGIAVDKTGNVYFTDRTAVYKMAPGGTAVVIATFKEAASLTIDADGNLYVADQGDGTGNLGGLFKMNNDGSNKTLIDADQQYPRLVAVDSTGDVFTYSALAQTLYKYAAGSLQKTVVSTSFQNAVCLGSDKNGNIYVGSEVSIPFSSGVNNNIYFISSGGGTPQLLVTVGLTNATSLAGVATDAANNLYILYVNINHLNEVDIYARTGGYSVSPALPAGLVLDNNTGIISGTPTATSPPTNYTVAALNSSGSSTATITIQVGPAPALSYGAAQTYNQKTAISPLTPSNSGAAVTTAGYSAAPAIVAAGFNMPAGVTADAAGNIYVADKMNNTIQEIPSSGGNPESIGSGFNAPAGIVADAAGSLYIADSGNGAIKEIPQGNGAVQTLVSGLTAPQYIARDAAGNLFVANSTTIYEIASGSGTATMLVTGFSNLTGISVDGNDNLYISGPGKVYKMRGGNNTPLDLGLSITAPAGVAVDASGNLFITDTNTHALYEVAADGSSTVALTAAFNSLATVSVGADGKIYVSDPGAGKAFGLSPTGGFYLNSSLPDGLVMDPATGTITGTPKIQSTVANYTVTAYAGLVSGSSPLTISVGQSLGAPVISYQNPPAYPEGAAIARLLPTSSGAPVGAVAWGAPVPFGFVFSAHWGIAVDSKGNIYVTSPTAGAPQGIYEMPADGSAAIELGSNETSQLGVAVDSTGNVYFTGTNGLLYRVAYGTTAAVRFGPASLSSLFDVAVDGQGNVYTNDNTSHIYKITPDGSTVTTVGSSANGVDAFTIAVDASGNIYFGDQGGGKIKELPVAGGNAITLATGVEAEHIAVDKAGNVYEADVFGKVNLIPAGGGAITTVVITSGSAYAIAVDAAGNIYEASSDGGQINKISPTGGYFISRGLPQGLSFNMTTGLISGSPTAASAMAVYTVTAWNSNGSSSANIILATGQLPAISYAGPQTYTVGTAISALSPANIGAAVSAPGYSILAIVIANGLGSPQQIASDAAGNIYVADKTKNMITKIPASGGSGVCVGGGFNKPSGVAIDKAGNVYVADAGNAAVKEIPVGGGFITTVGSGFIAPAAVAMDTLGNIYVADVATVYKITPSGTQTPLIAGFSSLSSITVSPGGKLVYVADSGAGKVYQITTTSSPAYSTSIGGTFNAPSGIARDNSGNLFVSDATRQIFEILNGQDTQAISLGLSLTTASVPVGLLVDPAGNLYFSDAGIGQVEKVAAQGGYYLNTPLPEGLSLDNTTGTISGTPKSVTAAANYTITAYAGGVSGQAVLNIGVTALQSAPVIKYSLEPTYAAGAPIGPLQPINTGGTVDPAISYNGTPTVMGAGVTPFGRIVYGFNNTIFVADKLDGSIAAIFSDGTVNRQASFLYQPNGIAVDNIGGIWIADNQNVRVLEYGEGSNTFIIAGGSFQVPTSIAADFHGHIFVGDLGLAGVYRMQNDGSNIVKIDNGITHPDALASDAAGNVYAVSSTANALYKIPADGSPQVTVATFTQPTDVTLDPDGNIFVATNDGHIYMILASGGAPFLVRQSAFANISGLTVDPTGVLYVGQSTSPGVSKLMLTGSYKANSLPAWLSINRATGVISGTTPADANEFFCPVSGYNAYGSSTYNVFINTSSSQPSFSYASPTTFYKGIPATLSAQNAASVYPSAYYQDNLTVLASGFNNPRGVAVDTSGNIYVADQGNNMIKKVSPQGGAPVCVGTGFKSPTGIAVDNAGNIYVADSGNGLVKEIPAAGGPILVIGSGFTSPQALAIDLAGNLYVGDAGNQAIYKITAGSRTQSLVINTGFTGIAGIAVDADGTLYTADSNPNVAQLIYKLPTGSSSFTPVTGIESINQPGNLTVDPLGNLYFLASNGQQIFEFVQGNQFYSGVPAGWAGNAFGMTMDGTGSFMVTSNNSLYKQSPTGGFYINKTLPKGLKFNSNSGVISGTPQVTSAATNYKVTGYYAGMPGTAPFSLTVNTPSTNATLSSLTTSSGTLSPVFSPAVSNYAVSFPNTVSSITITAVADDPNATVATRLGGSIVTWPAALSVGPNIFIVTVTAQDGITNKKDTVAVTRAASINANLASMGPSVSPLSPLFVPGTTSYTLNVGNATASMTVKPVSSDPNATITVNGAPLARGTVSNPVALAEGTQTLIKVVVTAQNGTSTKTYTITVTRAPSANAALSALQLSAGTLKQPFAPGTTSYTATVPNVTSVISVTPTAADPNAMITVNGSPVTSGSAAGPISLNVGANTITTVVTAQDGATKKTYTITVTRSPSVNANLGSVGQAIGPLTPGFSPAITGYALNVGNATATMTVKPVTIEPNATLTVNTAPASSGVTFGPIGLSVGSNTISIKVTAQDGLTTKTYTITVTRAAPTGDNAVYQPVGVAKPADIPGLAEDGIVVHQGISPNGDGQNDFLLIDNISLYPENKLSIMNRNGLLVYEAKGYDNTTRAFDGHSSKNGQMQLPGTYFYELDYTVNGATKHKTGFIVLKY